MYESGGQIDTIGILYDLIKKIDDAIAFYTSHGCMIEIYLGENLSEYIADALFFK